MTSFISAFALFILVLSNDYFTLPIDEQISTSIYSFINDETTVLTIVNTKQSINIQLSH
jgi:hypothetical protein